MFETELGEMQCEDILFYGMLRRHVLEYRGAGGVDTAATIGGGVEIDNILIAIGNIETH